MSCLIITFNILPSAVSILLVAQHGFNMLNLVSWSLLLLLSFQSRISP